MIVNHQPALACTAGSGASRGVVPQPRTPERILAAAERLFAERGYDATSLGEIADRVGIRPQAIYNHFESKWQLYEAVLERLLDPFLRFLDGALATPPSAARSGDSLAAEIAFHAAQPEPGAPGAARGARRRRAARAADRALVPALLPARAAARAGEERDRQGRSGAAALAGDGHARPGARLRDARAAAPRAARHRPVLAGGDRAASAASCASCCACWTAPDRAGATRMRS